MAWWLRALACSIVMRSGVEIPAPHHTLGMPANQGNGEKRICWACWLPAYLKCEPQPQPQGESLPQGTGRG